MEQLLIALPILIFSVVVHEVAHAWVARSQGDNTAFMLGRITLNPLPHLDPLGSVLVPGIMALTGGPILGWAKPVPVNPRNFRNYKRGDILVSLAGIASNLALAVVFTLLLAATLVAAQALPAQMTTWEVLVRMFQAGIFINFLLALFNLIPIPPLDGSHVIVYLLPVKLAVRYRQLGRYGMLILFALLFLGGFTFLVWPIRFLTAGALTFAQALAGLG
ncbi:MAG TPA: site-2 protease family protein [Longimicrobiaceae bacterium]|nr:site-2 protease family protein [Longimicrobiaceae bacterium]